MSNRVQDSQEVPSSSIPALLWKTLLAGALLLGVLVAVAFGPYQFEVFSDHQGRMSSRGTGPRDADHAPFNSSLSIAVGSSVPYRHAIAVELREVAGDWELYT